MGSEAPAELAGTFADVARALQSEPDVQRTLQRIVNLAVETIEGCDHAGVTLVKGKEVQTPASSDDVGPRIDALQYETNEGPCLDAFREQEVFQVDHLDEEVRWPDFAPRAFDETGVRSILAFRLFVQGDTLGALNLYSLTAAAFDDGGDDAHAIGSVFAAHAALALSTAQHEEQMDHALASRDLIGQAKGILMNREGLTADQAFDMLRQASQHLNMKLRELAERVTYTGELPPERPTSRRSD